MCFNIRPKLLVDFQYQLLLLYMIIDLIANLLFFGRIEAYIHHIVSIIIIVLHKNGNATHHLPMICGALEVITAWRLIETYDEYTFYFGRILLTLSLRFVTCYKGCKLAISSTENTIIEQMSSVAVMGFVVLFDLYLIPKYSAALKKCKSKQVASC